MKPPLTMDDFRRAAASLNVDLAAVRAVAEVESSGVGFLPDDRPTALFEAYQFSVHTGHAFDASYPTISSPKWDPSLYARGATTAIRGAGEWKRYALAASLNQNAARLSTSLGEFQIMGFNYSSAGFPTVDAFWEAMAASSGAQLDAFCAFIKANKLDVFLRKRDWAGFAYHYNGTGYRQNDYDGKLARAYSAFTQNPS